MTRSTARVPCTSHARSCAGLPRKVVCNAARSFNVDPPISFANAVAAFWKKESTVSAVGGSGTNIKDALACERVRRTTISMLGCSTSASNPMGRSPSIRRRGLTKRPSATRACVAPVSSCPSPNGGTDGATWASNLEALTAAALSAAAGRPRATATLDPSTRTCASAEIYGPLSRRLRAVSSQHDDCIPRRFANCRAPSPDQLVLQTSATLSGDERTTVYASPAQCCANSRATCSSTQTCSAIRAPNSPMRPLAIGCVPVGAAG